MKAVPQFCQPRLIQIAMALAAVAPVAGAMAPAAQASILYDINNNACTLGADFCDDMATYANLAGQEWSKVLRQSDPTTDIVLKVVINFNSSVELAGGRSLAVSEVSTNGLTVYEQGAAAKLRGINANGNGNDIELIFNPQNLVNRLWFGTNPSDIPSSQFDALSVFSNGFGHAFAFNGFRNPLTGSLPGNYESTFDAQIASVGNNFFFQGDNATRLYGGPVPLTFNPNAPNGIGNLYNLGNLAAIGPGSDLSSDLMNGVQFEKGKRYNISALDVAILQDIGIATNPIESVPTPPLLLSTLIFGWFAKRKKDRMEKAAAAASDASAT
jgi:hypothetical protein